MSWKNHEDGYGLISITFHWVIAIATIGLFALGYWMVGLSYYHPWYHDSLSYHKAIGVLGFFFVCVKLLWFVVSKKPALEKALTPFERVAATWLHRLINLTVVALPITGYIIATSKGDGIEVFGLFIIPSMFPVSAWLNGAAESVHYYAAYLMAALILLHVAAALKHHFVDKGETLLRMVPRHRNTKIDSNSRT